MRKDRKKILDELAQKERLTKYKAISVVAFVFFGFVLYLLLLIPSNINQVKGTAVRLTAVPTEEGNRPLMLVKLNNGNIVRASMPEGMPFHEGALVNIITKESITGSVSYSVQGYASSAHNQ